MLSTVPPTNCESAHQMPGHLDQGTDTLWVFLLELLSSADKHGHIICWTDYAQAEFKLYKPSEVAALWGRRKNRPAMNYDKLSRSLRYYYKKNILRKVPGRKYVYQFCRLDQLLASINPLNSPIANAYCQIFSQHLVANLYNQPKPMDSFQHVPSFTPSFPSITNFANNQPTSHFTTMPLQSANTPVSFKPVRPTVIQHHQQQPLTPSDDELSNSGDEETLDVEESTSNPIKTLRVSPQTAFAQYAAIDGNSQPESIPPRQNTPLISQITPSASGSEGRTPSLLSCSGEPPAKQMNLESSSDSSLNSSTPAKNPVVKVEPKSQIKNSPVSQPQKQSSQIAERRALKRKPEPLKFNTTNFTAANLAASAISSATEPDVTTNSKLQHFAYLNSLSSLQNVFSPLATKSLFHPLSASLATPKTTDWLKLQSPIAPQAQPVSTFTFPPLLPQLNIPAPLPSPMITTPLFSGDIFNFSNLPQSANMQSLLAAAQLASSMANSTTNNVTTPSTASSGPNCL